MAKRLYDEERIRDIARKIRQFVPPWHSTGFTTKEMADAVEQVYEEGKFRGQSIGYSKGYSNGYSEGYYNGHLDGYAKGKSIYEDGNGVKY